MEEKKEETQEEDVKEEEFNEDPDILEIETKDDKGMDFLQEIQIAIDKSKKHKPKEAIDPLDELIDDIPDEPAIIGRPDPPEQKKTVKTEEKETKKLEEKMTEMIEEKKTDNKGNKKKNKDKKKKNTENKKNPPKITKIENIPQEQSIEEYNKEQEELNNKLFDEREVISIQNSDENIEIDTEINKLKIEEKEAKFEDTNISTNSVGETRSD